MKTLDKIKKVYDATTTAMSGKVKSYIETPVTYQTPGRVYYKYSNLKKKTEDELTALVLQKEQLIESGLTEDSAVVQEVLNNIKAKEDYIDSIGDDDVFTETIQKEIKVWDMWADKQGSTIRTFLGIPLSTTMHTYNSNVNTAKEPGTHEADAKVIVDKGKNSAQNFQSGSILVPVITPSSYSSGSTSGGVGGTDPDVDNYPTMALIGISPQSYNVNSDYVQVSLSVNNWDAGLDDPQVSIYYKYANQDSWSVAEMSTELTPTTTHYFNINPQGDLQVGTLQVVAECWYEPEQDTIVSGIVNFGIQDVYQGDETMPYYQQVSPVNNQVVPVLMENVLYSNENLFGLYPTPPEFHTGSDYDKAFIDYETASMGNFSEWNNYDNQWVQTYIPQDTPFGNSHGHPCAVLESRRFRVLGKPGVDVDGSNKAWDTTNCTYTIQWRALDDDGNPLFDWLMYKFNSNNNTGVYPLQNKGLNAHGLTKWDTLLHPLWASGHALVEYKLSVTLTDDGSDLGKSWVEDTYFYVDGRVNTKPRVHFILEETDPDGLSNYLNGQVEIKAQVQPLPQFPSVFTNFAPTLSILDANGTATEIEDFEITNINNYEQEDWMLFPTDTAYMVKGSFDTTQFPDGNYEVILGTNIFHYNPNANYGVTLTLLEEHFVADWGGSNNMYQEQVANGTNVKWTGYSSEQLHRTQISFYNEQTDPPPDDDGDAYDDSDVADDTPTTYVPTILPEQPWFTGTNIIAVQDRGISNRHHMLWRRTPWMNINPDDNAFINKIHLDYRSNQPLKIKIYGDYDPTPITTINFDSTGGNRKLISKRVSARAKTFQFDIGMNSYMSDLGTNYPSDVRLRVYDLEIDVNEFK